MYGRGGGRARDQVTAGHPVGPRPRVVAPDTRDGRGESVAQRAGEGGRAQEGVVERQQSEVGTGHLQGRTLDQPALGHGGGAPAAVIPTFNNRRTFTINSKHKMIMIPSSSS